MSTGGATSLSSRGCSSTAGSKRGLTMSYVPGSKVEPSSKRTRRKRAPAPELPSEIMDRILEHLAERRAGGSVVVLGMVNRAFRAHIANNAQLWYKLYLHWRGPVVQRRETAVQRPYGLGIPIARPGVVQLVPSTPRTVPNFRTRTLSMR